MVARKPGAVHRPGQPMSAALATTRRRSRTMPTKGSVLDSEKPPSAIDAGAPPAKGDLVVGGVFGGLTVLMFALWIIGTRFAAKTTLSPFDVAFIRYLTASAILAPFVRRNGFGLRRAGLTRGGAWIGFALFRGALWAGYTLAFRRSGVGPWHAAAIINFASLLVLAPIYFLFVGTRLGEAHGAASCCRRSRRPSFPRSPACTSMAEASAGWAPPGRP
jgi:hypothetical protein